MGDASGRRSVPKELRLAGRGQGRPGLSLLNPDTNLEALSQICYPGSSSPPAHPHPHQLASLAVTPLLTQNGHSRRCLKGNYTCGGTSLVVRDVHSVPACLGLNLGSASSLGLGSPLCRAEERWSHLPGQCEGEVRS